MAQIQPTVLACHSVPRGPEHLESPGPLPDYLSSVPHLVLLLASLLAAAVADRLGPVSLPSRFSTVASHVTSAVAVAVRLARVRPRLPRSQTNNRYHPPWQEAFFPLDPSSMPQALLLHVRFGILLSRLVHLCFDGPVLRAST